MDLAEFRGCVIVVLFFASWSREPSLRAMTLFERLHSELYGDGLRVVGVAEERSVAEFDAFLVEAPLSFPVAREDFVHVDVAGPRGYRIWSLPETYVFDRHGVQRDERSGFHDISDPLPIEAVVRALLAEP